MNKSDSVREIATALNKAQSEMKVALKDSTNPFFESSYADFASVWETCREPLTKNGLSVSQLCINEGELIGVETVLMHNSGEWISSRLLLKPVKSDPQSQGSALTYARRYSLSGIVTLATEADDDANEASKKTVKTKPETFLTVGELVEKMTSSANIFELKNRYTKYAKDISALSGEDKVKVTMSKDKRKVALEAIEKEKKA